MHLPFFASPLSYVKSQSDKEGTFKDVLYENPFTRTSFIIFLILVMNPFNSIYYRAISWVNEIKTSKNKKIQKHNTDFLWYLNLLSQIDELIYICEYKSFNIDSSD